MNQYATQADALAMTNALGQNSSYTVGFGGPQGGYTSWRLASNSTGSSSQAVVYNNGDDLNSDGVYRLQAFVSCFREGSTILCEVEGEEKEVPVEELKVGTRVKTNLDGYKPVVLLAKGTIENPGNDERVDHRLQKCSPAKYPELTRDLQITGCHSILEYPIPDARKEAAEKYFGKMQVTSNKWRVPVCTDERAEPWNSEGVYPIWHFALEHADEGMNQGVQANGGLLVETCAIRTLKNKTNLTLIQ